MLHTATLTLMVVMAMQSIFFLVNWKLFTCTSCYPRQRTMKLSVRIAANYGSSLLVRGRIVSNSDSKL